MPRVNPWSLPREPLPEASETFSDGNGSTFTLRLRGLDGIEMTRAGYRANDYTTRYVNPPDGAEVLPLGGPDGEIITLTEPDARVIAELEEMQVPDDGEAPYNLVEWYGFGKFRPDVWIWAVMAASDLLAKSQERLKNSPGAAPEP